MTDKKQLTGIMIAHGNQCALDALARAGVPLSVAQKLILSRLWRDAQRASVSAKLAQIKPPKQAEKEDNAKMNPELYDEDYDEPEYDHERELERIDEERATCWCGAYQYKAGRYIQVADCCCGNAT